MNLYFINGKPCTREEFEAMGAFAPITSTPSLDAIVGRAWARAYASPEAEEGE